MTKQHVELTGAELYALVLAVERVAVVELGDEERGQRSY